MYRPPAPGPRLHLGTSRETDKCRASACALPINSRQMRSVCPLHRTCTPGGGCHILLQTCTRGSRSRSRFLPSRHKTSCVIPHRRALEDAMCGGREWGRTRAYRDTNSEHPLHLAGNGHYASTVRLRRCPCAMARCNVASGHPDQRGTRSVISSVRASVLWAT